MRFGSRPAGGWWPAGRSGVLLAVFAGGCVGGLLRYAVTRAWPSPTYAFPWAIFTVNLAGTFVLALLVVVVTDVLAASTLARPLVGTGFCGALTTFSTVVVDADQLIAHGHAALAVTYLVASVVAGLLSGVTGLTLGRVYSARRRSGHGS